MRPGDLDCFHCRLPMLYGTMSKAAFLDDCWTRLVRKYDVIVLGDAATRAHESELVVPPRSVPTASKSRLVEKVIPSPHHAVRTRPHQDRSSIRSRARTIDHGTIATHRLQPFPELFAHRARIH